MKTFDQIFAIRHIPGNGHLAAITTNGVHFPCSIGHGGISHFKQEGDGASPAGVWRLRNVMYRPDRIRRPLTTLPTVQIKPDMGWCDDPNSIHYNTLIKLPFSGSHEKLWREDNLYDLLVELDHNSSPVVQGKGSAIFMHVRRADKGPTEGCIAMPASHLLRLLETCRRHTAVSIGSP